MANSLVGQTVRVVKVLPQNYNDESFDGEANAAIHSERDYHAFAINQTAKVISKDDDPKHPYMLEFEHVDGHPRRRFSAREFVVVMVSPQV